jgi:hypothetical protein
MDCAEYQDVLLAAGEGPFPSDIPSQLEAHLSGCAGCRSFRERLKRLEVQLAHEIGHPSLKADFSARLLGAVDACPLEAPVQREALRDAAERDYQAQLARLRRDWRKRKNWRLTALVLITLALWVLGPSLWSLLPFAYRVASWLPNIAGIDPLVPLSSLMGTIALAWFAYRARREGAALRQIEV